MNWPRLVSPVVVQAYLDLYELLCCLNFEPELLGLLYPPDLYTSSALSCDHTTKLGPTDIYYALTIMYDFATKGILSTTIALSAD